MKSKVFSTFVVIFVVCVLSACYKTRLQAAETALVNQNKDIVSLKENLFATVLELINLQLDFSNYKKRAEAGAFDPRDLMHASVRLEAYMIETEPLLGCTATLFEKEGNKYAGVTSAHCVSVYNPIDNKGVMLPFKFRVVVERPDMSQDIYPLDGIRFFGNAKGIVDDVAMFEVTSEKEIPMFKLADRDPMPGEHVSMVSWHFGLGNQYYRGNVTRNGAGEGVQFVDKVFLLELVGLNNFHGASGSAIVGDGDGTILGILWGSIDDKENNEKTPCAVKVSVFRGMYNEYKNKEKAAANPPDESGNHIQ